LKQSGFFQVLPVSALPLGLRQVEVRVINRLALFIIIVGLIIIRPGG